MIFRGRMAGDLDLKISMAKDCNGVDFCPKILHPIQDRLLQGDIVQFLVARHPRLCGDFQSEEARPPGEATFRRNVLRMKCVEQMLTQGGGSDLDLRPRGYRD